MNRYDPDTTPDATAWLALGEGERLALVERWHREARVPIPAAARRMHAILHTLVESQALADADPTVRDALARMQAEGLSRHDAVHAVGWILAGYMQEVVAAQGDTRVYRTALNNLTAAGWKAGEWPMDGERPRALPAKP